MSRQLSTFKYVDSDFRTGKSKAMSDYIIADVNSRHIIMHELDVSIERTQQYLSEHANQDEVVTIQVPTDYNQAFFELQSAINNPKIRIIVCSEKTAMRLKDFSGFKLHIDSVTEFIYRIKVPLSKSLAQNFNYYFDVFSYVNNAQSFTLLPKTSKNQAFYDTIQKSLKPEFGCEGLHFNPQIIDKKNLSILHKKGIGYFPGILFYQESKLKTALDVTFYHAGFEGTLVYKSMSLIAKLEKIKLEDVVDRAYDINNYIEIVDLKQSPEVQTIDVSDKELELYLAFAGPNSGITKETIREAKLKQARNDRDNEEYLRMKNLRE